MATISRLKPGQIVWSVGTSGPPCARVRACWPVTIVSVDLAEGFVTASWNHNQARRFSERHVRKWRLTPLKPKI
jgi:hypothetical protein